jgi:hypothetical protein
LVSIVVAVSGVTGWTITQQELPYHGESRAAPTAISIRVFEFRWIPEGCGFANHTSSGGLFKAGSNLSISLGVTNRNPTMNCLTSSVALAPAQFLLSSSNLPLNITPDSSASILLTIEIPDYDTPTGVTITISAGLEA